jgi:hypothetical protein
MSKKKTDTAENGQMFLGSAEDGFVRPLRETDPAYIGARKARLNVEAKILTLQEEIKEMKEEAMEPIKGELKECVSKLDALEHLYAYRRLAECFEEARIRSLEENNTFVVYIVSQKLTKSPNWCFVCSIPAYLEACGTYGTVNVFKIAVFDNGKNTQGYSTAALEVESKANELRQEAV